MMKIRAVSAVVCVVLLLGVCANAAYDQVAALRAVYYTKVSKCNPLTVANWSCGPSCANFTNGTISDVTVVYTDPDQTQMFIAYNAKYNEIAVSYRGSTTLLNWIEDAEAKFMPYPYCTGCLVHTGFYTTYAQIEAEVSQAVKALLHKYPTASIFIVGHSLGSAQARICALDMQRKFGNVSKVRTYTIGTPRFGNNLTAAYAESLLPQGEHYYITHDADPVPHLPPLSWGYIHAPQEVWYKQGLTATGYKVCNGTAFSEDPTCADSLLLPIDIEDHLVYLGVSTGCGAHDSRAETLEAKVVAAAQRRLKSSKVPRA